MPAIPIMLKLRNCWGNVIIKKDSITLRTNKAILYSKNDELELFNDIIMTTNEDTLLCDTLYYFPKDQEYIIASGNIRLSKAEGFLVSDSLYFWSLRDSMIAKGDVQFKNKSGTISSQVIHYHSSKNTILAVDEVLLKSINQSITSDSLYYWISTDSIIAIGDVKLTNQDGYLTSNSIHYSEKNNAVHALGDAYVSNTKSNISAQSIYYIKDDGYYGYSFTAQGNVIVNNDDNKISGAEIVYVDSTQNMSILEDASIINQNQKLIGKNIFIQFKDSTIDQINIDENPMAFSLIKAKLSDDSPYHDYVNTMFGKSMLLTYDNNKLKKMDIIGMANSVYHVIENTLLEGTNEVSGDTISLSFIDEELAEILVRGGGIGMFIPELSNSSLDTVINYSGEAIHYNIPEQENYFLQSCINKIPGYRVNC